MGQQYRHRRFGSGVLLLVTFLSCLWWTDVHGTTSNDWEAVTGMTRVMAVIALYAYCYGLSAILFRQYVLANQVKANMTWLIAGLLVGLGSSIPSVIAYIAFYDEFRQTQSGWWSLTNPFVAIFDICYSFPRPPANDFETLLYWFLGIWATLVTVLCLPWIGGQLRRFHPPKKLAEPARVIVLDEPAPAAAG